MAIVLPELPWAKDALEPQMSKETIEFHYGKHHATYVNNINNFLKEKPELAEKSLEDLVINAPEGPIYNNAAQVWNHNFFWKSLKPNKEKKDNLPTGSVSELINTSFGSFDKFKEEFSKAAVGHFGSGWAWLVLKSDGKLAVEQGHDAQNPLRMANHSTPILVCDVWEHAYYVDYRNNRADYIKMWWSLCNWEFANENLKLAQKK